MGGLSSNPSAQDVLVGGRYALERLLGLGGMGEVWQARHVALNSRFAIKLLQGALSSDRAMGQRFLVEAQVTAQLQTRHAVRVFDFGIADDGRPYLVMELLVGETLHNRLFREGRLEAALAVRFLSQAARALSRAHRIGIVHRDFKPSNIFITRDEEDLEQVKVMDFGLAKLLGAFEHEALGGQQRLPFGTNDTLARRGWALGTPPYMAPEQVRNSPDLDHHADVWAFGVVAYQCLVGRRPFEGQDASAVFHKILRGRPPRASSLEPSLPVAFDAWFERACALDPAARFSGPVEAAAELAIALEEAEGPPLGTDPGLSRSLLELRALPADPVVTGLTNLTSQPPEVVSRDSVGPSPEAMSLVLTPAYPIVKRSPRWPWVLSAAAVVLGGLALGRLWLPFATEVASPASQTTTATGPSSSPSLAACGPPSASNSSTGPNDSPASIGHESTVRTVSAHGSTTLPSNAHFIARRPVHLDEPANAPSGPAVDREPNTRSAEASLGPEQSPRATSASATLPSPPQPSQKPNIPSPYVLPPLGI